MEKVVVTTEIASEIKYIIANNLEKEAIKCKTLNIGNEWTTFYHFNFNRGYKKSGLEYLDLDKLCQCLFVENGYRVEETKEEKLVRRYQNCQDEEDESVVFLNDTHLKYFKLGMKVAAETLGFKNLDLM